MKKLALTTLISLCSVSVFANVEQVHRLLSSTTTPMTLALNAGSVRCLVGDYGASSLKITTPDLRYITMFRHTTQGETESCINAGPCKNSFNGSHLEPSLIIDPSKPTEEVNITVDVSETLTIDHTAKTCQRMISEHVKTVVRGLPFQHLDQGFLGNTDYELCLKMKEKL